MMWKIKVTQTRKYRHSDSTYTDSVEGAFKTAEEAVQFATMAMENFKDVEVEITYEASNIEKSEEQEDD